MEQMTQTKEIQIIDETMMQHGIDYIPGHDVTEWYAMEKYNGCRVYWDGANLWSRGGINVNIPNWWRKQLPAGMHLDCELYDGCNGLYRCSSAIRYGHFTESMSLVVFDAPSVESDYWGDRIAEAESALMGCDVACVAGYLIVMDIDEAAKLLRQVQRRGGEGLMLRDNHCPYTPGKTNKILKLKFID